MFCSECGSLTFPKDGNFKCSRCGFEKKNEGESQKFTIETREKETVVIDSESDAPTLPKTKARCPECENNEAFWVLRQTRAADEPETRIYRCTKCSHSWREY